jgi:hypothetical protein
LSATAELETIHAVQQVLHLYDHFVDAGAWEELPRVLSPDFELQAVEGSFVGADGARRFEQLAGEHRPAHHVLNTLVEPVADGPALRAWSRYLLVTWEYAARVGDYLDLLVPGGPEGWQLRSRRVLPRGAGGDQKPEHGSFAAWRAIGAVGA